jgi:hypothetical protein
LANDQESLKKLELSCSQATRDYEDSSKSRAEEMEALKKAEKVLAEKTGATIKSVPWQGGRGGRGGFLWGMCSIMVGALNVA